MTTGAESARDVRLQPGVPADPHSVSDDAGDSAELLNRCLIEGDSAADIIFARYAQRLLAFAQTRLFHKLAARIDPEDVVQSAWRSFFTGAKQGNFQLRRSGDLWRLLIQITSHKLLRQVAHHRAEKRSISQEQQLASSIALISREPSPDVAAAIIDELEWLLAQLSPVGRQALELRLQGERLEDIASQLGCTERTVPGLGIFQDGQGVLQVNRAASESPVE